MIYYFLFFWTILSSIILLTKQKNRKMLFVISSMLPLIIVASLRSDNVGTDLSILYMPIFRSYEPIIWSELYSVELGYILFNYIVKLISDSPIVFLAIVATITYGLIGVSFLKQSTNVYLSVILFEGLGLYFISFNLVRQYMAVAILSIAYICLLRSCYWKSALLIVLGFCFHRSALILLPFIILHMVIINRKRYVIAVLAIITLSFVFVLEYTSLISLIPKYADLYSDSIYGQDRGISAQLFLSIPAIMFVGYNSWLVLTGKILFNRTYIINVLIVLIYGILIIASYKIFILSRLVVYFEFLLCFVIPWFINRFKSSDRFVYIIVATTFSALYMTIFIYKNLGDIIPYTFRI